ncbi:tyrosine-type recombinase/integrase [Cerasicoccus fimbriatus]|uniref:tyrosine-type recombinase/integrase n=1 Tax=Cerasicoccus fimbriatus TaxID=3014554 RepID=UPI0022B5CD0B|nr:site-specific integrase [Cerasicoccus sp. TK19100]
MPEPVKSSQSTYVKVAECLYRHETSGSYYALVKNNGKQIRRSLKTKDLKLAKRRLGQFRKDVSRLDLTDGKSKISFAELAEKWRATITAHLKPSSTRRRETSINQLNRYFGKDTIRSITRNDCDAWVQKRSPKIAASTFNNERETLISIFDYAIREGVILENPATVTKRRRLGKNHILIPSKAEFATMIKSLRSMDIRYWNAADLVELLAYSGMRKGEANAFLWGDIDWERGSYVVTGGETGTKNHEARVVPLFPTLKGFLERKAADTPNGKPAPQTPVVPAKDAKNALITVCTQNELPHFTHHCMRHYFVSNAIEKGVDFKTIAAWVGHKDGGILVAKTYGHLRDTHSFEMAKRM